MITLPPKPSPLRALDAVPAVIRTFGSDLLAASAQVDDLGTFVADEARIAGWTGEGSTSYHEGIAPVGRRADALSLALRAVAQRVDLHADRMQRLVRRRLDLAEERAVLRRRVGELRGRAVGATPGEEPALQEDCDDCARRVRGYEADLSAWRADVEAEEQAMVDAFTRVLTLDQVERRYGGMPDPADEALDRLPGRQASPAEVLAWWRSLTRAEQQAVLVASPGSIGNRDGIPADVRDEANSLALERDLALWTGLEEQGLLTGEETRWLETARAAQAARELVELDHDPVTGAAIPSQLYSYDPHAFGGQGAVAVTAGRLGLADNVSVLVPGMGTDGAGADELVGRVTNLYTASRWLDPEQTTASLLWIDYDAPGGSGLDGALGEGLARAGGERLADTVAGLRAIRESDPGHLTVIGHSYGSTTSGLAAQEHGLSADDLVLLGSPGVGGDADRAGDLGLDPGHVWGGANSRDPVTYWGEAGSVHLGLLGGAGLGNDPTEDAFGGRRFAAESTTRTELVDGFADHSKYLDHDTESLANIAHIVNGSYDSVQLVEARHDPWWDDLQDPEFERPPTTTDTDGRG